MDRTEQLYRQHAAAVLRFAWGLCGSRHDAEDIVAETFVRLLTKGPRIEARTAKAYLLTIARNVWISGWRRRRREVLSDEPAWISDADPVSRIDAKAKLEETFKRLETLPRGEREALLLRVDHDMSYEEIASALSITVSAAKVRVHRARLRLSAATAPTKNGR
jgi:RNA polymerase sigma-70 factor (ECF subfamily)